MMKKTIFLTICFYTFMQGYAQEDLLNKSIDFLRNNDLINAKTSIDEVSTNAQTHKEVKAWYYKGRIYQKIHQSKEPAVQLLHTNPLNEAYQAFLKAKRLDVQNEYRDKLEKSFSIVSLLFYNKAVSGFNDKKYDDALFSFEQALAIYNMPEFMKIDTSLILNTAKVAQKVGQYDKAKKYYKQLISLDYKKTNMYLVLAEVYFKEGKYKEYEGSLLEGINACPKDNSLLIAQIISYYLDIKEYDKANVFIQKGLALEPDNFTYHYVLGRIHDQKKEYERAEEAYKKTITYKPNHFDAYKSLGVLYYNSAIRQIDYANSITVHEKHQKEKAKVDVLLKQSMLYYEKAQEIKTNDEEVVDKLMWLYEHFEMFVEFRKVKVYKDFTGEE